eukprot:jgi/Psemu1/9233/gm1.9233_g
MKWNDKTERSNETEQRSKTTVTRILSAINPVGTNFKQRKETELISEIFSVTDEAFALMIIDNEFGNWEKQKKRKLDATGTTPTNGRFMGVLQAKEIARKAMLPLKRNKDFIKFKFKHADDKVDDIIAYSNVINYIHQDSTQEDGKLWSFRKILGHQGPLNNKHPQYKGSKYNLWVEWENMERTYEPLANIAAADPVTAAKYTKDNDMLDKPGWTRLKCIINLAKRTKKLDRLIHQAKLRSFHTAPHYSAAANTAL